MDKLIIDYNSSFMSLSGNDTIELHLNQESTNRHQKNLHFISVLIRGFLPKSNKCKLQLNIWGTYLGIILEEQFNAVVKGYIFAALSGIFVYLSLAELFPVLRNLMDESTLLAATHHSTSLLQKWYEISI